MNSIFCIGSNFLYFFSILILQIIAAHNKSPARLSEAYLCTVYFGGDYSLMLCRLRSSYRVIILISDDLVVFFSNRTTLNVNLIKAKIVVAKCIPEKLKSLNLCHQINHCAVTSLDFSIACC